MWGTEGTRYEKINSFVKGQSEHAHEKKIPSVLNED